jgi:outer membrane protein assembly factor BamA
VPARRQAFGWKRAGNVDVDVTGSFVAGEPYRVSAILWKSTSLYSDADFARDAKLHAGEPAAAPALALTEADIQKVDLQHGYLDAYVTSSPVLDTTAHAVAYTLAVVPGDLYHVRSVHITGLTGAAESAFNSAWMMKAGDLYDGT